MVPLDLRVGLRWAVRWAGKLIQVTDALSGPLSASESGSVEASQSVIENLSCAKAAGRLYEFLLSLKTT